MDGQDKELSSAAILSSTCMELFVAGYASLSGIGGSATMESMYAIAISRIELIARTTPLARLCAPRKRGWLEEHGEGFLGHFAMEHRGMEDLS
jgi:hypothetical protein